MNRSRRGLGYGVSRDREAGMSLVEVAAYLGALGILAVPILMITVSVSRMSQEGLMLSKILERNRVAADRLTDDFTNSISGTAVISNGGRTLRFTQHGGFNGSTSIAGDILRYELQADPDDPENGSDDNDNGIIDEGILVRVNETTGETVTLTASLDLGSCSFVANGTGVTVTITTIGTTATAPTSTRKITALSLTPLN